VSTFFDSLPDLDAWSTMSHEEQARSVQQVAGSINDQLKALVGPMAAEMFAPKPKAAVLPDLAGDPKLTNS